MATISRNKIPKSEDLEAYFTQLEKQQGVERGFMMVELRETANLILQALADLTLRDGGDPLGATEGEIRQWVSTYSIPVKNAEGLQGYFRSKAQHITAAIRMLVSEGKLQGTDTKMGARFLVVKPGNPPVGKVQGPGKNLSERKSAAESVTLPDGSKLADYFPLEEIMSMVDRGEKTISRWVEKYNIRTHTMGRRTLYHAQDFVDKVPPEIRKPQTHPGNHKRQGKKGK